MPELAHAFYKAVKNDSRCLVCDYQGVQFHHVKPENKISEMRRIAMTGDLKATIEELNKCVPLCHVHHLAVHKGVIGGWLDGRYENGSKSMDYKAQEFMPYLGYLAKIRPHVFTRFYTEHVEREQKTIAALFNDVGIAIPNGERVIQLVPQERREPAPWPPGGTIPLDFGDNVVSLRPRR